MFGTPKDQLERMVALYPKGSEIDVWYSPTVPSQAVIENELLWIEWFGYLLLILVVVVPRMLILWGITAVLWAYEPT